MSGETRDFGPRWRYLGVDTDRIVVSDGSSLKTLFDARLGKWAGGGFFTNRFDSDALVEAVDVRIWESSDIADWPGVRTGLAVKVGHASSQSQCEVIAGIRVCPREESFNISEAEYYRAGIGPVGYSFSSAASFSGGGFFSSYQTIEKLALVGSSLRNLTQSSPEEDLPSIDAMELEPNDSREQAQVITENLDLRGHVTAGDTGGDPFTLIANERRLLIRVHDYYIFDLLEAAFVDVSLVIAGVDATYITVGLILWNNETGQRLATSFNEVDPKIRTGG